MGLTKVTYAMIEGAVINVLDYGAVADGSTDDTAAIQAAVNALVDVGGGQLYFPSGIYNCDGNTIYVNSTGTSAGEGFSGITVVGCGKENTILDDCIFSVGYRSVQNADQTSGGIQQASNSISIRHLSINGGLELYSVQRASYIEEIRIQPTALVARGFYAVFCNTMICNAVRVDNGGASIDGIVLDTCPNMVWTGGSASYNQNGILIEKTKSGSQNTVGLKLLGLHLEGNRKIFAKLVNLGSASAMIQVVADSNWDNTSQSGGVDLYPLVQIGGGVAATDTVNVHIMEGSYINGYSGSIAGTAVQVLSSTTCEVNGARIANVTNGIDNRTNALLLTVNTNNRFDSSVTNEVVQSGGTFKNRWQNTLVSTTFTSGSSNSVTPDVSVGLVKFITTDTGSSGTLTINSPINTIVNGETLQFSIYNTSGGTITLSWNAAFVRNLDFPTSIDTAHRITLQAVNNGSNWYLMGTPIDMG